MAAASQVQQMDDAPLAAGLDGACAPLKISSFFRCVLIGNGYSEGLVNSEYMKQALAKVGNPNVLVNLISRRVRQLTTTGNNRPLIEPAVGMGAADVALMEIIHDKMAFEMSTATEEEAQPAPKKRRRA
jgi:DNA-directed RNA polymerase subunit omega